MRAVWGTGLMTPFSPGVYYFQIHMGVGRGGDWVVAGAQQRAESQTVAFHTNGGIITCSFRQASCHFVGYLVGKEEVHPRGDFPKSPINFLIHHQIHWRAREH